MTTPFHVPFPVPFPVPGLAPLRGREAAVAEAYLDLAARQARTATCLRSRCGSVVVAADGMLVGGGANSLPGGSCPTRCRKADGDLAPDFKSDRTCCTHAEVRAIVAALASGADLAGASVYFTRVDANGARVPSGRPYCTICSKLTLEAGLATFVLAHDFGVVAYPADLYNDLSFSYGHPSEPAGH